ncbi:division/cell wall cluster transcriptional repressor MraZ [Schleiferilactobacillus shenzhenensis]|uniref:Transcriptional regulator MraZ n=1 Tax=Schleiferilactobacillus shenzhenensis LY-73 TaxID=1231336 RepID=U4TSR7_9LACO|nr:division/cell wall cluster transcriptional repressor MraZ [Schleiferilactobacillus shenzhenensis]ERL66470.1 MraZ [Schleiferilactobacillus shenzhenensis LY-73]
MLMGEYHHTIDTKGRLIVPAKFRSELGATFVVTRGLDTCLFGYPLPQWQKIQEQLAHLPTNKKDARAFTRFFYSAAAEVVLDKQGRINVPDNLRDFAHLTKECVFVGVASRIEIWAAPTWAKYMDQSSANFDSLAEDLMDIDL